MNVRALIDFLNTVPDDLEVVTPGFDHSYNRRRHAMLVTAALYHEDIEDEGEVVIEAGELCETGDYTPYEEVQVVLIT